VLQQQQKTSTQLNYQPPTRSGKRRGPDPRSAHVVKSRGEGPAAGDGAPRGGGGVACGSDLAGKFSAEEIRR